MKYARQYATEAAYNADTTRIYPNVSLIKEGEHEVKYNPSIVDGKVAEAGTVVLAKTSTPSEKIFVPYQALDVTTYAGYTPIGVVVMPYTHTPDNTVRIMSLKNMSLADPENGSVASGGSLETVSMYFGGFGTSVEGLTNKQYLPNVDATNLSGGTIGAKNATLFTPCDYVEHSQFKNGIYNPLDPITKYASIAVSNSYTVSPYDIFGLRSANATSKINKETNGMVDYDGYGNTSKILAMDNALSTDWQTTSTIVNNSGSTNIHAPAQCCWRYTTIGVDEHKWYLPSCGEMIYFNVRYGSINNALTKLMELYPTLAVRLWRDDSTVKDSEYDYYGSWFWSSTMYSNNAVRNVAPYRGTVGYTNKSLGEANNRTRAFAALQL